MFMYFIAVKGAEAGEVQSAKFMCKPVVSLAFKWKSEHNSAHL